MQNETQLTPTDTRPPGLYSVVFTTRRTGDDTADIKVMLAEVLAEFPRAERAEVCRWFVERVSSAPVNL